jgi:hypothetical protein
LRDNGLLSVKNGPQREWLASAHKTKVRAVETNLGTRAATFDVAIASLALPQFGNSKATEGFPGSGYGGLVTPPGPGSLSADSNWPGQRRKNTSSSRARGRSASQGGEPEVIVPGAESEDSTTSSPPIAWTPIYIFTPR